MLVFISIITFIFSIRFNFGSRPFKFPPDAEFRSFNSAGSLSDEQRMILPRHMRLQLQVLYREGLISWVRCSSHRFRSFSLQVVVYVFMGKEI